MKMVISCIFYELGYWARNQCGETIRLKIKWQRFLSLVNHFRKYNGIFLFSLNADIGNNGRTHGNKCSWFCMESHSLFIWTTIFIVFMCVVMSSSVSFSPKFVRELTIIAFEWTECELVSSRCLWCAWVRKLLFGPTRWTDHWWLDFGCAK